MTNLNLAEASTTLYNYIIQNVRDNTYVQASVNQECVSIQEGKAQHTTILTIDDQRVINHFTLLQAQKGALADIYFTAEDVRATIN